jgi:hypothetical protein
MFYCKYCSDSLEIIKNTNISNEDKTKQIENPENLFQIYLEDIESKKNRYINSDFQYTIMWPENDIENLNFKELIKNNNLNNISEEDLKNILINKYREFVKSQKNISTFYLSCTNCSTTYFLEPETIIDSINFEKSAIINDDDIKARISDPTLLRTKDYICPNSKCQTNLKKSDKNMLLEKEAVFYRSGKEYNIKYICCLCNTQWGT